MAHSHFNVAPPVHRGMTELDRDAFQKSLVVLAARVKAADTGRLKKAEELKSEILDLPKIRSVEVDPTDPQGLRLILLGRQSEDELPAATREYLATNAMGLTTFRLDFGYDYWNADEILQAVLPEDLRESSPTSFTLTGHIGHVNLRDEYLPYKHLIGQIILDKNKTLRTVVNKIDVIDTEFRVFKMEVIAGEPDFNVVLNEHDCTFAFDFRTVYWNSRLQAEHARLISLFQPGQVVADVFAGVGPFAVPSAKKGVFVLGNDLNPNSSEAMQGNAERNKVQDLMRVTCQDGREFIRSSAVELWNHPFPHVDPPKSAKQRAKESHRAHSQQQQSSTAVVPRPPPRRRIDHFVMNLPASAIEFLDAFRGVLTPLREEDGSEFDKVYGETMPMVHCHAFTRELDPAKAEEDLRQRAATYMGVQLPPDTQFHLVRSVAPKKEMYCFSFRLPKEVALA